MKTAQILSNINCHFDVLMDQTEQERIGATNDKGADMRVMRMLAAYGDLREENRKLRATIPPRPADNRNREQESWDHRFGFLANK